MLKEERRMEEWRMRWQQDCCKDMKKLHRHSQSADVRVGERERERERDNSSNALTFH